MIHLLHKDRGFYQKDHLKIEEIKANFPLAMFYMKLFCHILKEVLKKIIECVTSYSLQKNVKKVTKRLQKCK